MPDFLTRRDGTWHFVRRVPTEFASFDARGIVRHSTKVRIREDRNGRRASRIADKLNAELEAFWRASAMGPATEQIARYDTTRQYARTLGFEYVESDLLHARLLLDLLKFRLTQTQLGDIETRRAGEGAVQGQENFAVNDRRAALGGTWQPLLTPSHVLANDGVDRIAVFGRRFPTPHRLPVTRIQQQA
jgi:hypothetical protein